MKNLIFTEKDFLAFCDKINMFSDNVFIWIIINGKRNEIEFDFILNSRKEAKDKMYKMIGKNIFDITIKTI